MVLHLSFPKQDIFIPLNKNVTVSVHELISGNCIYVNNLAIYCKSENAKPLKDHIAKLIKECIDKNESMSIEVEKDSELGQLIADWQYFE
jgi:hypothetical protein